MESRVEGPALFASGIFWACKLIELATAAAVLALMGLALFVAAIRAAPSPGALAISTRDVTAATVSHAGVIELERRY